MAEPLLSEIKMFSFNFPPKGWALCNGQILPINQNQALFALLGTTYGGDGQVNFALPNLRGRVPLHPSVQFNLGQTGGSTSHTLSLAEMPSHTHTVTASSEIADSANPQGRAWATGGSAASYHNQANSTLQSGALGTTGGSQPHNNMAPYLVVNFCIALQCLFPSRD